MKRGGQWVSLLWISAALSGSQAPASASLTPDKSGARWDHEQAQAVSLPGDLTSSDAKKTNGRAGEADGLPDPMLHAAAIHRHAPVLQRCGTIPVALTKAGRPVAIGLPLSRGPPCRPEPPRPETGSRPRANASRACLQRVRDL